MKRVKGYIQRKTMLYKTGVEYGDYTMNHVQGCAHGCLYPCYAFLLKKRFGQVKSYKEFLENFCPTVYETVFMTENGYGLLNGLGEEIIKPEGIEKLSAVSNELICANLGKGKRVYYKLSEGSARVVDNMDFDGSRINFELLTDGDEEYQDSNHFVVTLDGERIYDSKWTSFEIVDPKKLDTSRNCSSVYSAWNGTGKYYLVFDRYYNLTVYKAEYAKVMLKIGEDYGECYITDPDDYDDLVTLINSFGNEGRDNTAETGSGGDYIKIAGGLSSEESKWIKTLTADGYCYTESFEDEDGSADISVDVMNPRTYTDLVDWTEAAVTSEYGTK